jgi:non-ribosomal peptide synthetase component E (peptide arylation enzyme)
LDFVSLHAQSKPDAVAQIEEDRRLTWRELLARRNRLAGALAKLGVST